MNNEIPTISDVQTILAVPKEAANKMVWKIQIGNYNPYRYMFDTALKINNEIREDLYFRARVRGSYKQKKDGVLCTRSANISSGLHIGKHRIFAYDYDERKHLNKIGKDLPYHRKSLSGLHKHIWTEQGYGYAEPLSLTGCDPKSIIEAFLKDSNITIPDGFQPLPLVQSSWL